MGLKGALFVCWFFLAVLRGSWAEECVRVEGEPACVCHTSAGIVDLRPLANTDGTPMFNEVAGPNGFHYSYNPCYAYSKGTCVDAYICQWSNDPSSGFSIADNNTEVLTSSGNGTSLIKYTNSNPVATGGAQVHLYCDQKIAAEKSELMAKGSEALSFTFELTSCQVCPGGCKSRSRHGVIVGLIGLVLIVLVFVVLLVYCISGAIFLKIKKSDDIIPNQGFWLTLPLLIKGGCEFTFEPCMKLVKTKDGYSNI